MKIEAGKITTDDGKDIGTARLELKYGYHPAVLVEVGKAAKWFEADERDLLAKIRAYVAAVGGEG